MNDSTENTCAAKELMNGMKASCSQAIFATFGPYMGEKGVDAETCMNIASAFGGGINMTGNVCGALTGALMAIGLEFGDGTPMNPKVAEISTRLLEEFKAIHGSILCQDLIQYDGSADEVDLAKAFQSGAFDKCLKIVEDVAGLLKTYIE
ncbi:MAG: C-GCAxxG-C-C family protein [Candidatus Thorarchaeota archaeon]|nr:C-GCAxxG-C-C family protein [Candidatus Thorarchaeota archaeon]